MSHSSYSESKISSDFASVSQLKRSAIKTLICNLQEFLWKAMIHNNEPQIRIKFDRQGHPWWEIHDPSTNQSISLASESEVRIWLERRFLPQSQL